MDLMIKHNCFCVSKVTSIVGNGRLTIREWDLMDIYHIDAV